MATIFVKVVPFSLHFTVRHLLIKIRQATSSKVGLRTPRIRRVHWSLCGSLQYPIILKITKIYMYDGFVITDKTQKVLIYKNISPKAIVDIRLRPRCAIPPPLRGRYAASHAPGNFQNTVCACLAHLMIMIPSAAWRYWRLSDLFCSDGRRFPMLLNDTDKTTRENCSFPLGDLHPHLTHGSEGPPESLSKMACRSVHPFSHSSPHSVPLLYNGPLRFPQKLPLSLGGPRVSIEHIVPRTHTSHQPKRHLDRFSRCRMGPKCYAV